jgi:hypothetical protein
MTDELQKLRVAVGHYEDALDLSFEPRHNFLKDPDPKEEGEKEDLAFC